MPIEDYDWADMLHRLDRIHRRVVAIGDVVAFLIGTCLAAAVWYFTQGWNVVLVYLAVIFTWGTSIGVVRAFVDPRD